MVELLSSFSVHRQSFGGEDAGAIGIEILRALAVIRLTGALLEQVVSKVPEECQREGIVGNHNVCTQQQNKTCSTMEYISKTKRETAIRLI